MFLRRRQAILSVHGIDCCGGRHWNKARSWRPHCCCRGHWFSGAGKKDRCLAKTMLLNMLSTWSVGPSWRWFFYYPTFRGYFVIFVGYDGLAVKCIPGTVVDVILPWGVILGIANQQLEYMFIVATSIKELCLQIYSPCTKVFYHIIRPFCTSWSDVMSIFRHLFGFNLTTLDKNN